MKWESVFKKEYPKDKAFPIQTFYHQNFTRYHVRLVRHFFFYENMFTPLLQNHSMQQIELL